MTSCKGFQDLSAHPGDPNHARALSLLLQGTEMSLTGDTKQPDAQTHTRMLMPTSSLTILILWSYLSNKQNLLEAYDYNIFMWFLPLSNANNILVETKQNQGSNKVSLFIIDKQGDQLPGRLPYNSFQYCIELVCFKRKFSYCADY